MLSQVFQKKKYFADHQSPTSDPGLSHSHGSFQRCQPNGTRWSTSAVPSLISTSRTRSRWGNTPQKPNNTQKYPEISKHAQEADVVLLLQPDHSLHPHRIHGCAWLHFAPGFGREALSRWWLLSSHSLISNVWIWWFFLVVFSPLKNTEMFGPVRRWGGVDWLFTLPVFAKH